MSFQEKLRGKFNIDIKDVKINQFALMEKMLHNPNQIELIVLNKILKFGVPFNSPHGIKIVSISDDGITAKMPYKNKNLNHIKSIHACGIATIGEFCAGMSLVKEFSFNQYRLIMSELDAQYHFQAKKDILAHCTISKEDILKTKDELELNKRANINVITKVKDIDENLVATITTKWQLKSWDKVSTKI